MRERWEYLRIQWVSEAKKGERAFRPRAFIWGPWSESPEERKDPVVVGLLNEFGAQGWELVSEETAGSRAYAGYRDETDIWVPATSYPARISWTFKRRASRAAATATEGAVESREEQTFLDVILRASGDRKIQVIKVVMAVTGLDLKEAKALVDEVPSLVKAGVGEAEAEKLKADLEEAGATVELR